jgi:predicted O-methyltransferase YrrM
MINIDIKRLEEIKKTTENIQGWCNDQGAFLLYALALNFAPGNVIVELGSWKGLSTVWLANAVKDKNDGKSLVYAVDTWDGSLEHKDMLKEYEKDQLYKEFLNNILSAGVSDFIIPLRGDTISITRQWPIEREIGLLHIDASHEYDSVRKDFEFWSPLVMRGGGDNCI